MHPRHKQHVNFLKDFKVLFRLYKTNILVYVILSLYWIPAKKKKKVQNWLFQREKTYRALQA